MDNTQPAESKQGQLYGMGILPKTCKIWQNNLVKTNSIEKLLKMAK